ncbi:hypothetical protein DPMN_068884 [Dreissena polymorpha]|uniref:Uncharacterized protein n=1 Tax=Dreissena polymorpha TaxID=45954 RepID=A0A9D3Z1Z4_DREPO|nr:hypothetical protein DPMN_068884 [Dreissena polymorpha]
MVCTKKWKKEECQEEGRGDGSRKIASWDKRPGEGWKGIKHPSPSLKHKQQKMLNLIRSDVFRHNV